MLKVGDKDVDFIAVGNDIYSIHPYGKKCTISDEFNDHVNVEVTRDQRTIAGTVAGETYTILDKVYFDKLDDADYLVEGQFDFGSDGNDDAITLVSEDWVTILGGVIKPIYINALSLFHNEMEVA